MRARVRRLLGVTVAAVVVLAVAGCSGGTTGAGTAATTPTPSVTSATTVPSAAASSSETKSAAYIETLNPSQQGIRESLAPDKLAKMTDEQITAAFTIPATEVTVGTDGQIDPKLYAEAFVARSEGALNLGCSQTEYDKWGGVDMMSTSIHAITLKYSPLTSAAFFGRRSGDTDASEGMLTRCMIVDSLLAQKPGLSKSGLERFHARITLDPASPEAVVEPNNTTTVKFECTLMDNWASQIMLDNVGGIAVPATDHIAAYTFTGLRITPEGSVFPGAVNVVQ